MDGDRPLLVVVNGRPCTGKSHLANLLSKQLGIPLIAKDAIKEALGSVLGVSDRQASRRLGSAAFALLYQHAEAVLCAGFPVIIEAPLSPDLAEDEIETLRIRTRCRILQVFLRADPSVILRRFKDRNRGGVHFDDQALVELEAALAEELRPVALAGHTKVVDTTDFRAVDYEEIVALAKSALEGTFFDRPTSGLFNHRGDH